MRGLITAIRTLTVLRVPGKDAENFSESLYFFPVIGGLVGALQAAVMFLVNRYTQWPELAVFAGLAVSLLVTGGLHIDGLADIFDSLGGATRERRLEIMKDSRVGVYGVAGVVLCLLAKYICLVRIAGAGNFTSVIGVCVIARVVQVAMIVTMPYARAEGTARLFVSGAGGRHLLAAVLTGVLLVWLMMGTHGLVLFLVLALAAALIRMWARRHIGGVTGDVIGFSNEMSEVIGFIGAGL